MDLTVVDATGNKTEEVSVPDNVASGRHRRQAGATTATSRGGPDGQPLPTSSTTSSPASRSTTTKTSPRPASRTTMCCGSSRR